MVIFHSFLYVYHENVGFWWFLMWPACCHQSQWAQWSRGCRHGRHRNVVAPRQAGIRPSVDPVKGKLIWENTHQFLRNLYIIYRYSLLCKIQEFFSAFSFSLFDTEGHPETDASRHQGPKWVILCDQLRRLEVPINLSHCGMRTNFTTWKMSFTPSILHYFMLYPIFI